MLLCKYAELCCLLICVVVRVVRPFCCIDGNPQLIILLYATANTCQQINQLNLVICFCYFIYINNIDHDVHKEKYKRSKNYFKNSNLKVHKVNAEDEVKHRLEVKTKSFTIYSYTVTLKLFSVSCKFINIILIFGGCTTSYSIYSVQL